MISRSLAGLFFAAVLGGVVLAEDTRGTITKIEDGSITIKTGGGFGGKTKTESQEKTFKISKDVKVTKVGGKEAGDVSLTVDELKIATKVTNVFVTVTHEGDNGTEIKVGGRGGVRPKQPEKKGEKRGEKKAETKTDK